MFYRQQWAQSVNLLKVVVALALAIVTLMAIQLLFSSRNASAQTTPKADYQFQDTRSSSVGTASALTDIGPGTNIFTTATVDGSSRRVLSFPQGNGLKLSPTTGVVWNGTYTIVALFEFDSVSGYRRIIDFKNGTSDNGLYVNNGNLEFFRGSLPSAAGTGAPIAPNTYVEVTLTRNSSGTVAGYVDGELQFSFSDYPTQTSPNQDAVIDTNNALRFFRDNESDGANTEHSAGSVARIRLYDEALPTTFTVNSTGDQHDTDWPNGSYDQSEDGRCDVDSSTAGNQCTLRAAFQVSNLTNGEKTIAFDIPGAGLHTITPNSALPQIYNNSLTIDGYTQPGASANTIAVGNNAALKIELSGANAGAAATGIRMRSWNNVVKGLIINRWGTNGVELTNGSNSTIEGNYIGTDKNGTAALANGNGVTIATASNNVVGGTVAGARNVISGNSGGGVGIGSNAFESSANPSDNSIQGNYIGTDASGTQDLGNGGVGVNITHNQGDPLTGTAAGNNVVGGTTPAARNLISGNDYGGVVIIHDTDNNQVVGNYIGTDVSGTLDRGNTRWGVEIFNSSNNVVGGMTAGAGNRISGNSGPGVSIGTAGTSSPGYPAADNHVINNSISANDGPGVSVSNHPTNLTAVGNSILRNSIFDNIGLGIDLDGGTENTEGVTRNDTGDGDTGPNRLQNFPVISSAITSGGQTTIEGTINSTGNDRLTIQFFSSPAADTSGWGEGKTYIGETTVDTNPEGNANFSFITSTPVAAGQVVTATATSTFTSDTSEFSAAKTVGGNTPPDTTRPTVLNDSSLTPAKLATGVSRTTNVSATFSEEMRADTLSSTTIKLQQYNKKTKKWKTIPATLSLSNNNQTVTLDPYGATEPIGTETPVAANKKFRGFITTGAKDLAGNPLASNFIWTFKTGSS